MIKLNPSFAAENLAVVPIEVSEKHVERYLASGWTLAEGEKYTPSEKKKGGRELYVDPALAGSPEREYGENENDGEDTDTDTGVDTGTPLGANDAITTPVIVNDNRKVIVDDMTGDSNLPALTGLDKEKLIEQAGLEHVDLTDVADTKPGIKKAIEEAREARKAQRAADTNTNQ